MKKVINWLKANDIKSEGIITAFCFVSWAIAILILVVASIWGWVIVCMYTDAITIRVVYAFCIIPFVLVLVTRTYNISKKAFNSS